MTIFQPKRRQAKSPWMNICSPSIIYTLLMMEKLLSTTEVLHLYLQTKNLDLSKAISTKDAVLKTMTDMRNSDVASVLYTTTQKLMPENNIIALPPRKRSKKRKNMDDYICTTTIGQREDTNDSESMRTKVL